MELEDFEAENLAKLQKMFSRKWEFVFMQAEAQYKYIFLFIDPNAKYRASSKLIDDFDTEAFNNYHIRKMK